MTVRVTTFGYAHSSPPPDATLVLDCRLLGDFRETNPDARALLEEAVAHARANPDAVIAFGCEWGESRSRALAATLRRWLGLPPASL